MAAVWKMIDNNRHRKIDRSKDRYRVFRNRTMIEWLNSHMIFLCIYSTPSAFVFYQTSIVVLSALL